MYGCARHSVRETYCSTLNPCSFPITLGNGSKDSFTIRGWQLWLKQWIFTLHALYFLRVFCVSSCVLNEFIRTSGTEHPYVLFKCCREKTSFSANMFIWLRWATGHPDGYVTGQIWFQVLYYYMRNFCNLIGLEQWYFCLLWNTYKWKLQTFCGS